MSDELDLDVGVTSAVILSATRATPAELLQLAKGRALDPSAFEGISPFFWPAEISSTRLDAYYGHMAEDTLRNFAADAAAGVSQLVAHDSWRALPIGASLTGQFLSATGQEPARTVADFYTIPGLTTTGQMSSDEVITRIRTGVQRDVSVGFHIGPRADGTRGRYVCDICGGNLMDWRACPHWPGLEYEYTDPATGQTSQRLATFTVFNGTLSEVSPVYDGATPGAVILKARAANSEGLTDRQITLLEQRYRTRLPARRIVSPGVTLIGDGTTVTLPQERAMPPSPTPAEERATSAPLAETTADLVLVEGTPDDAGSLRQIMAACDDAGAPSDLLAPARVRWLADELTRLRPLADDGRAYREDLVAEALAEGVRALGQGFREETYRRLLTVAPVATIRQFRDDWREQAATRLPSGRQSRDDADREPAPKADSSLPATIYQH